MIHTLHNEVIAAVAAFEEQLETHPECCGDLAAEAAIN